VPAAVDLLFASIATAAAAIRSGSASPLDLAEASLARIEAIDGSLRSYVTVTADLARAQARQAGQELAAGRDRGPLHGIPVGLKDAYATRGVRTTAHSRLFADWVPAADATTVARLRNSGAVLLGKHGMAELAFGGPAADGIFPAPRNPWQPDHEPGGSSSGSGAAVAAGLCYGALGTDAGGSIRKPAAHCGVVGLKPTYGRVSRNGIVPLAWSLDHPGPMGRTVEDVAILLGAVAGADPLDPSAANEPVPDYLAALEQGVEGLRLGVATAWLHEFGTIDPEILAAFERALAVLEGEGASIVEIESEPLMAGRAATTVIITAEAFACHERTLREHPELLGRSVKKSFGPGMFISAADYLAAQRARAVLRGQVAAILRRVDAIVSPTCPRPAARLDAIDFDARFAEPSFVNPYNLLGLPAVSVPCGFTGAGLPVGLQIAAAPFEEAQVLRIARAYERVTPWHERHPPLD
jgi:aspartyl-tRNA(Asn)/glutamyl-tRNA(Gln) amidotransferase subunit A